MNVRLQTEQHITELMYVSSAQYCVVITDAGHWGRRPTHVVVIVVVVRRRQ